jgi:hypothetical protein
MNEMKRAKEEMGQEMIVQPGTKLSGVDTDPGCAIAADPDPAVYEAFLIACRPLNNRAWAG